MQHHFEFSCNFKYSLNPFFFSLLQCFIIILVNILPKKVLTTLNGLVIYHWHLIFKTWMVISIWLTKFRHINIQKLEIHDQSSKYIKILSLDSIILQTMKYMTVTKCVGWPACHRLYSPLYIQTDQSWFWTCFKLVNTELIKYPQHLGRYHRILYK